MLLDALARRRTPFVLILVIAAAYGVFFLFPGLDLATSRLFFDGRVFPVQGNPVVEAIRRTLYAAEDLAALLALMIGLTAAWREGPVLRLQVRDWAFGFCVFALGPGLMANVVTKRLWGRARPWNVTEFGGTLHYSQPWQFSDQCQIGCSFVSGEMAGATALVVVLIMVLHANRQMIGYMAHRLAAVVLWAIPLFTAWQRIASGKHFLSDVVFAALFVLFLTSLLALLFQRRTDG